MAEQGDLVQRSEILPLLNPYDPKLEGGWVKFHCPVPSHGKGQGDRDRSAGLSRDGVLKCFSGCAFSDVMAMLRKGDQRPRDNTRSGRTSKPRTAEDGLSYVPVRFFDYRDASGVLVAQHVRSEATDPTHPKGRRKKYTWRIAEDDPRTLREAGLDMTDLPLFNLACLKGLAPGSWVEFPEGEGVVEALAARNRPAVCHGGGASWRDFANPIEALRGFRVRVWPDNDEAGFESAAAIARGLKGIARQAVVMPAVGERPGDDLADYFARGGNFDDLLAGTLVEDSVEFLGDTTIRVRLVSEQGEVSILFDELAAGLRDLQTFATVTPVTRQAEEPHSQHINLYSSSGMEGWCRTLGRHFLSLGKEVNWTALTNRAVQHVRRALDSVPVAEFSAPWVDAPRAVHVLKNLVIDGGGTILFSPPKRGKTTVLMAMAVSIDCGLHGVFQADRPRPVLYVNLERSRQEMLALLAQTNRALGVPTDRPIWMIHRRGRTLLSVLPYVRKAIREQGVEVVILDSLSRGGFGQMVRDDTGNVAMDMMNSLGTTWIASGHTKRPEPGQPNGSAHLYGTIMQDAAADVMVKLASKHRGTNVLLVSLQVTDANQFGHTQPVELELEFSEEMGLVAFRKAHVDAADAEELGREATPEEAILAVLGAENGMSAEQVAKAIDRSRNRTSALLSRMVAKGLVQKITPPGFGVVQLYALAEADCVRLLDPGHRPDTGTDTSVRNTVSTTPPLERGVDTVSQTQAQEPDTADTVDRITCGACGRSGMRLAGYDPRSTPENEITLCPTCLDDIMEEQKGA